HWHVHLFAQCAEGVRRGGVARDDDALHSLVAKKSGDLATVPSNGFRALRAVWDASRVAEVDDTFVRELSNHFFGDREPTDPRVEHADCRRARPHHVNDAPNTAPCGIARIARRPF